MQFFFKKRKILTEGAWVSFGQVVGALGTLVGIRLITEYIPPEIFGAVTLLVGGAALVLGIFCTPLTQAALYFYPKMAERNDILVLRSSLITSLKKIWSWLLVFMILAAIAYCWFEDTSVMPFLLLIAILIVDVVRSFETTFLNASRRQKRFALWSAAESWLKPVAAIAMVFLSGASIEAVLAGYLVASIIALSIFVGGKREERVSVAHVLRQEGHAQLNQRIWRYALPLIPLALIGWVSGIGDRYIIGGMLGMEETGIYAAVYGLVSRPFLMLGRVVELTLRPVYQHAVSNDNHERAGQILNVWLLLVLVAAGCGLAIILLWHQYFTTLLLGKQYHAGGVLMPWIAGGYFLLILSYVYERVCYAHGRTDLVLIIQLCGVTVGVILIIIAIMNWGLIGAAMAVPLYFGIQLVVSFFAALISKKTTTLAIEVKSE